LEPDPALALTTRTDTSLAWVFSPVAEHPDGITTAKLSASIRTGQRNLLRFTNGRKKSSDKLMPSAPFRHQLAPDARCDSWLAPMVRVETPGAVTEAGEKSQA
jgi:hypothetical protein